jgi:hypothetical protein
MNNVGVLQKLYIFESIMKVFTNIWSIMDTFILDVRSSISSICNIYVLNNLKKQHVYIHKSTFNIFRR